MKTKIILSCSKNGIPWKYPLNFIILFSIASVFYGCASGVIVTKEIELSRPVDGVFLSVGEKSRPAKMDNQCTIGGQLDVFLVEASLNKDLSKSLKEEGFYLSESAEKADLTIAVRIIDYKVNCWQGWMTDKNGKKETLARYAGLRSFLAEAKYLDSSGVERGIIQVETGGINNLKDAARKVSEKIAKYTKEKIRSK